MDKKYILQVCAYSAPYPGNFIATLTSLAKFNYIKGYTTIFAFPETAKLYDWCNELEKTYIIYYLPLKKARINLKTYIRIRQIYKENNIVIAHSHFELYDIPVSLMAPKEVKLYWHLHDALELIYKNSNIIYRLIWKIQYAVCGKNVVLLSVSEKGKEFASYLGFRSSNSFFVPNGIDINRIDQSKNGKTKNNFLIYGWDYYRKGVDILINAVEILKDMDFECRVVADIDVYNKISEYGYKQIRYQKPVQCVADLYSETKCFLHISRHEGLSYALLEAIYAGCIVICSDIEQNRFAKCFPNVFFVPVGDSDAVAKCMKSIILGELKISNSDIKKAKEIITNEYSLDAWLNKIQGYYFDE